MECAHCAEQIAELEEQVAFWQGEARALATADVTANLQRAHGLTRSEARLLQALYKQRGRPLDRYRLSEAIESRSGSDNLVTVLISNIRRKIGVWAVMTDFGSGYSIGSAGIKAVEAVQPSRAAA